MTDKRPTQYQQLLEATTLALMFPLTIGCGFGLGYGLDRWLGTRPWLTGAFTALGVAAAFVNLFRTALRSDERGEGR